MRVTTRTFLGVPLTFELPKSRFQQAATELAIVEDRTSQMRQDDLFHKARNRNYVSVFTPKGGKCLRAKRRRRLCDIDAHGQKEMFLKVASVFKSDYELGLRGRI